MEKITKKVKILCVALAVFFTASIGSLVTLISAKPFAESTQSSYVEMYSPLDVVSFGVDDEEHLNPSIVNNENAPHGKALQLDYKLGATKSISVNMNISLKGNEGFNGYAFWVDLPESQDDYSFTNK